MPRRLRRRAALLALGVRRVVGRTLVVSPRRFLSSVLAVAIAVGFVVTVSGVALGLAAGSTVESPSVDYWIVPEDGGDGPTALPVGGSRLGEVHGTAARLNADDRIDHATPVLVAPLAVENPRTGEREYVVALGLVPAGDGTRVSGLSTDHLRPGDPHYADGGYDGDWTGEAVLNPAAAERLGVDAGDELRDGSGSGDRSLAVTAVDDGPGAVGGGMVPLALVHLSELQALTGADAGDQADQLLVRTDSRDVKPTLAAAYPRTKVVPSDGFSATAVAESERALAIGLAASLVALVVGVLFVATVMGLEVTADREQLAVLDAVGFSPASRGLVVLAETLAVAACGGVCGVLLGGAGIVATNAVAGHVLSVPSVARFHVALVGYGVGLAVLVGLLAAPYPLLLARRASREGVTR
ncbi:ABC transporter permease [Halorarum salinum]|uniref:ABC transporter permease n=1 Tax=Halorarum salinum TaxID=2743089 RepID=A0A7D5QIU7_9EURY|nr:ABC transporter permease [Halobaculum salinum]QLG63863.1 ABC transporter permease [Halobaculum salinum]